MKEKILELRKKGYSYNEIVEELKCAKSTVSYHLSKLEESKFRPKNEKEVEDINNLYILFLSVRKVAKQLNMDRNTVIKYLSEDNFKIFKNRIKTTKTKSDYVVDWRKRSKEKLVEYKGGKCQICGYNKCLEALEFHHLDRDKKDFTISGKSWSFDKLKNEVDKCILVCSNCHKEIHSNK